MRRQDVMFVLAAGALAIAHPASAQLPPASPNPPPMVPGKIAIAPGNLGNGNRAGAWIVLPAGMVSDEGNALGSHTLNGSLVPCSGTGRCRPVYRIFYCESPPPAASQINSEQVQCYETPPLP